MPTPEPPGVNPNGFFDSGTTITVDFLNAVMAELCYVITQTGATLSKTDTTQLYTAINQIMLDASGGSGITALEDDLLPKLGGDLDVNGHFIESPAGDILIQPTSGIIILDTPGVMIGQDLVYSVDNTTKITFGTGTQTFIAGGVSVLNINASGMQIGSGARVTTIDNDPTMAATSSDRLATQSAIKGYVDSFVPEGGTAPNKINFFGSITSSFSAGSTWYYANVFRVNSAPGGTDATKYVCFYITGSYTINNLTVGSGTAPGSGFSYACTVFKNGSATSLTATIVDTNQYATDSTHSFSVIAGDVICLEVVVSSGATTASLGLNWSVLGTSS